MFAYCNNNPVQYVDFNGNKAEVATKEDRYRFVGIGFQGELDVGGYEVGFEIIVYYDELVCGGKEPLVAVYLYEGAFVDNEDILKSTKYLQTIEKLTLAITTNAIDEQNADALLKHFKEFGMKEGRIGKPEFNVKAYMKNNLDLVGLIKADDMTEYFAHYIKYGKQEGRVSTFLQGQEPKNELIATHTTYYDASEKRAKNVELAASRINGTILAPGKKFSFSTSVGTRTIANGYVNGPSFAGGKEVESIGGGICQVSSNLYVTLLLAGIEPDEHHYHGLAVDYVPIGLDAAIAEGYWDLRFTNPFSHKL